MATQLYNIISATIAAGASVALPHGLNWQGRAMVPDRVDWEDASFSVVADDTNVTITNDGAQEASVEVWVQVIHTYLRAFGGEQTTALTPRPFYFTGTSASSGRGSYIEISGQEDVSGSVTPVDQVLIVYVQSDYGASGAWAGPGADTYGSDDNPGTKDLPFLTLQGVWQRYGRRGIQGVQIIVKMGGYSVRPAGGWPSSPIAANDPWDGDPTEDRAYFTRELTFDGADGFRSGYAYHGPRKMFPSTTPLTFVNAVQVGLRVRLTFLEGAFGAGSQGTFLRLYQPDGRDVFFPHQISEVIAPTQIMVEPPFTAADWAFWAAAPNVAQGCVPAVQILGGPDYEATGVHIHGSGAGRIGDGRTGGGPVTTNPIPHLFSVMVIRPTIDVVGQWMACATWFDDGTEFCPGSQPVLKGCSGGPNGYVRWAADGRVLNADSNYLLNTEICGYALVPALPGPPPADVNPVVQTIGPPDLVVAGSCNLVVTDALGAHPGTLRVLHGLSVITTDNRTPLHVYGKGAVFAQVSDAAAPTYVVLRTVAVLPCVWAVAGASVFLNPAANRLELANGGGGTLRAGKGAAIAAGVGVGEWLEVAGFNGNFTRRLEGTAAAPTDDTSEIVATTWMPAGYGGVT